MLNILAISSDFFHNTLSMYNSTIRYFSALFISLLLFNPDHYAQTVNLDQLKTKEANMKYIETFKIIKCEKISLHFYKKMSDSRDGIPPLVREISDKGVLGEIVSSLSKLPDKGDMMVKMGDVAVLKVIITIDNTESSYFEYYEDSIKTPATSFYSESPSEEKKLYELLMSYFKSK